MDILIKNCDLISMAYGRPKIEENMSIYIERGRITKIGKLGVEVTPNMGARIIDAEGKICMPGLINTHTHLSMSIFRETLDGYSLQSWLNDKIWPMEDKLESEDVYYASLLSCLEMISTGTTTANDQYFMTEDTIRAGMQTGVRLQVTRTINDAGNMQEKRMEELKDLINRYRNKSELITFNVGIHGLYTTGRETIREMTEYAKENELPIHMHFCENEKEVEDIQRAYSVQSPVDVLGEYFRGNHNILAHVVKVSDNDIERLSKMMVNVSHCPVSNLRLGCGVARVQEMIDNGINVSLGTDGQGSGSNLDMFESMKFAALLQKGIYGDVRSMDSYEVLKMATINGAKALGLQDEIGSIEKGKRADIILLDINTEVMNPTGTIFSDIVYNAKGSNVSHTIINGKLLMADREMPKIDKEQIFYRCKRIIERISK